MTISIVRYICALRRLSFTLLATLPALVLCTSTALCTSASAQLTVNVPAGGDVQGASLQVLQAGGGTINLAAGNYYITGPIVLGSNTTLNGAGGPGSSTQSVIYAPQSPNSISMVTQAYAGASNLTVSNLVLDGNIPQAAMLYGTGNGNYAYDNNGIYIYDTNTTTVGVTLTNVEVRHTLRGILTGLVDNLTISGCYFHDNNPGGFSHNMYLVATSGVEIDHTRSNDALTGDGLHIDFGGTFYTIRKSEFSGNNGLGILSQNDNDVTIEDSKLDFNANEGIESSGNAGFVLTRDKTSENGGYGLDITDTADNAGLVNGFFSIQNDPLGVGGDSGPDYVYGASLIDFTEGNPGPNAYPAIQADGVLGIADTGDWTLNYPGYTYLGAVDFNTNHLSNGSVTFNVGNAVATGPYPLVVRYSNGTSSNQTMNLSIDGGTAVPVTFPPTGSYSSWATVTMTETLSVGNNTVTLSVPTGATSAPELDLIAVTAATPPAPNAPTNVTAVANGPYSVTLSWTPPANSNGNAAQTYNIYKNNRVPIVATKITGTTWTDTRIFYGETTNQYFVTAVNQGGESGASNTVTVTTGIDAPPGLQVSVTPSTPANNLSWLGVSGAASYRVLRSSVSGGPYQTLASVAANTGFPTYSDTSLGSCSGPSFYVVAAVDANNAVSANSYQVEALCETFTLSPSSTTVDLSTAVPVSDSITVVGTNGFSDPVNFSVSGLPSGVTASFSAGSASAGGSTQLTFTDSGSAALGSYPVTVTGMDGGLTSSVALTLNVGEAQTITFNAIPPQAVGNSLTVSATASSGLPVTFSVVPNGNCSVSGNVVTFLNTGNCGVLANQAGNSTYGAAAQVGQIVVVNSPQSQTIQFAAIASQPAASSLALVATATSGLPVSFASTTPSVCTVAGSTASLLAAGSCTVVASQSGGGAYGPAASVSQSFTVTDASQTIHFTPATPVTYGVAPIALNGTASSGLAVSYSVLSGPGSVQGSSLTITGPGTVMVAANQAGNGSYLAATQVTASIVVNPAPLTATANAVSYPYGSPVPLTGTVSAAVNGDSFTESFALSSGGVAVTASPVPVGSYTITPVLTPVGTTNPANYAIALTPATLTVAKAASATHLYVSTPSVNLGATLVFTVLVSSTTGIVPTQSVTLLDGATPLATQMLSSGGSAMFNVSSLTAGPHTITASYGGDPSFLGSSASTPVTVIAPAFAVSAAPSSFSVASGQTGRTTLTLTGSGGYSGTLHGACTGLAAGLTCNFSPATVSLSGSAPTQTMTLVVAANTVLAGAAPRLPPGGGLDGSRWAALPLALLGLVGRRRRREAGRLLGLSLLLALGAFAGLAGCGSNNAVLAPDGAYTVTVTVGDGSTTLSQAIVVTVTN